VRALIMDTGGLRVATSRAVIGVDNEKRRAAARGAGAAGTIQAAVNRTMSRDSVAG
jgi:hypothetical protein